MASAWYPRSGFRGFWGLESVHPDRSWSTTCRLCDFALKICVSEPWSFETSFQMAGNMNQARVTKLLPLTLLAQRQQGEGAKAILVSSGSSRDLAALRGPSANPQSPPKLLSCLVTGTLLK